jgi:hypothetical protein
VFSKKMLLGVTVFILAVSNVTGFLPSIIGQNAEAITSSPSVVYDALPSTSPQTNYPSVGYEATSTSEFGDYIHLSGTNRKLNTITVTMSDWAKYADYASNPLYSGNSATWSLPVTLNVYSGVVDADGVPTTRLATVTQTIVVPWRPAGDSSCSNTSNGNGWKVGGVCYNFSGLAFNAVFDLSSQNVIVPSDIIVGIAYNTQSHGYSPTGQSGPYNSLNVAVPANQVVSVGSDTNDEVVVNSTWSGQYGSAGVTGVFRKDTGWGPYGTVAMQVTATNALDMPMLLSPANGVSLNYNNFWFDWSDVSGAVSYEAQFSQSNSTDSSGSLNVGVWSGDANHNQPTESKAWSSGATGTWYWQVRAVDAVGNKSAWSTPWKITLDLIAPAAVTLNSPANGAVVNGASVTQSWNASASSDVDHYIYESYNDANATSLRWSQTVNGLSKTATNVANATYWWRVKAVDAAGNESAWSPLWKLTIDNDAPGAPVTTSAKPYYTKLGTPTKTLTWAPGANSSDVAYYEYAEYYNTAPTSETTPTNWLKTPIYGTSTTDTAWGSNIVIYWRVRAVDQAGNKSAWSDIGKIITDVDVPTVTVNPVASSEDTTPVITGTTSELGGDVTITVDGSDVAAVTSDTSGNWSWAVTTPLAVGSHIVLATAVDAAGNASSSDLTTPQGYWKQFTIQAPAVVQTTAVPTANAANNTGTTQPVVTNAVTATDGTGVLGTEDQAVNNSSVNTNDEDTNQVSAAGASDSKNDDGIWNLLGLAWYWWLLIIAAIAIVWGLLAARSRKRED